MSYYLYIGIANRLYYVFGYLLTRLAQSTMNRGYGHVEQGKKLLVIISIAIVIDIQFASRQQHHRGIAPCIQLPYGMNLLNQTLPLQAPCDFQFHGMIRYRQVAVTPRLRGRPHAFQIIPAVTPIAM